MKKIIVKQLVISMLLLLVSGIAASVDSKDSVAKKETAIYKMAVIMNRLKHFPSPQGKETLQQIIDSPTASEQEKLLATAIFNLNHRALMEDKIKLKNIMEDKNVSADVRDLASIVYHLDHRPTKADKARLQELLQ